MSGRRRRTPIGTQPPITSEDQAEAAGVIEAQTEKVEKLEPEETKAADQEEAVIVQIDDEWLERLDLHD